MKPEPIDIHETDNDADTAADAKGLADLDAGRVVTGDAVKRWLKSWGTANLLATPRIGD